MQVCLEMIKFKCFFGGLHSWWLLYSERGVQCWGCLLVTPWGSEGSLGLKLPAGDSCSGFQGQSASASVVVSVVVTPPLVCKGTLVWGFPAGDSTSGFWGESASATLLVSVVGSLNQCNMQNVQAKFLKRN